MGGAKSLRLGDDASQTPSGSRPRRNPIQLSSTRHRYLEHTFGKDNEDVPVTKLLPRMLGCARPLVRGHATSSLCASSPPFAPSHAARISRTAHIVIFESTHLFNPTFNKKPSTVMFHICRAKGRGNDGS